jgi:chromatin modification-related protein VID21
LFDQSGSKPVNMSSTHPLNLPTPPKDALRRSSEQAWTSSEDLLLKSLADKYPNNWLLITDSFNSSRVTISTDKRTPWDCRERWSVRWGPGSLLATRDGQAGPSSSPVEGATSPVTPTVGQMTTRGVKRLASASIAANNASSNASGSDSRKRRRHNIMYDAIRKAAKKREAAQKNSGNFFRLPSNLVYPGLTELCPANQRKPAAIHDTHGQYNKLPKLSPQELSRMKYDKELKEMQEIIARKRQEEMARQQRNPSGGNMVR